MSQIQTIVTPTGPLALIRPAAEKLLKEGVISGTLDGALHAADAATVKAALMAAAVCDFCSTPGATHFHDVPDFGITKNDLPSNYSSVKSTGGWMACDACEALIKADKRQALVDRSMETMAFPKFTRRAVDEMLNKFWQGMDDRASAAGTAAAFAEFVDDKLPTGPIAFRPPYSDRDKRIAALARSSGLSAEKIEALTRGEIDRGAVERLVAWNKTFDASKNERERIGLLIGDIQRKPLAPILPHWQIALDMKFAALAGLADINERTRSFYTPESVDLNDPAALRHVLSVATEAERDVMDSFRRDAKALSHAEAYSFNAETTAAIQAAAASVPHDTPLSAIDTPGSGRAGWFWFAAPLPVATAAAADDLAALLWYWTTEGDAPVLKLAAYVIARSGKEAPQPSLEWSWPLTDTFHEMIAGTSVVYNRDAEKMRAIAEPFGKAETLKAVADISLFFVAACVWMKQRILVAEAGHVERHARKRYVRDHKLATPPEVQVIALRRSYREPSGTETPGEGGSREYSCRWIVSGHPRLQKVGPGRKDVKLIWIDPYPKGPEDKPLRVRKRVYAVVR